jgi:predicted nucleic acid-binding Zn ribbon protein
MKALVYLLLTTLKNRILSLRKKPAMLILYLIMIVGITAVIIASNIDDSHQIATQTFADIRILYGITSGVALFFMFSFIATGLSTGSTLFTMADVGLLFVSPITSRRILVYGLIKQLGTTFLSAIFILYQVGTIRESFGLKSSAIFSIFIIYAIMIFFCQLMSIAIYIFTNGNQKRKKAVQVIFYGVLCLLALWIYFEYTQKNVTILTAVLNIVDNKLFHYIPVTGWATMFMKAAIEGNILYIGISLLLFLTAGSIMITLFTSGDADYYEDVLTSTEITFNRLQDAKDGKMNTIKRKVKVKEQLTGINRGTGASAIFYKHMCEKRRTSRLVFIDTFTILAAGGSGILMYFMKDKNSVYIVLGILVYIQFFFTILGKLTIELTKPYIYMIPEKSIKKVIAASITTLLKPCIDGVIIFTVVCIISKTSPLLNLFLALAYASSGAIFVAYSLLCQRVFGGQPNKLISAMLGMTLFMVVIAPGVGASIAAILLLPESLTFLGTLPFTFCCIVITILIYVTCGDLLDKAEYTGR